MNNNEVTPSEQLAFELGRWLSESRIPVREAAVELDVTPGRVTQMLAGHSVSDRLAKRLLPRIQELRRKGSRLQAILVESLEAQGHEVLIPKDGGRDQPDLIVDGIPIEIKVGAPLSEAQRQAYTRAWERAKAKVEQGDRADDRKSIEIREAREQEEGN